MAIETGVTWHHQAVELVQEIGRRTANITPLCLPSTDLLRHCAGKTAGNYAADHYRDDLVIKMAMK